MGKDGTFDAHVYSSPVNFKDSSGNWRPIDNTLRPGLDGGLAGYLNGANRYQVQLPQVLGSAPVRVSDGNQWIRFSLDGGSAFGVTSGSTETFAQALPGVDLTYTVTNTALKENLVLANASSPRSFSYSVSTSPGLTAVKAADGSIQFLDSSGKLVFSFLAPVMSDAAGDDARASYELAAAAGGYEVTLDADTPWLASPDRVWPVTVDPTVPDDSGYYPTKGALSPTLDGYVASGSNANGNWFGLGYEKVGWNSSGVRRGLFQFNAEGALPVGAQVLSATLQLYLQSQSTLSGKTVGVYQMVQPHAWNGNATWNTYDGTNAWTTSGGGGDYTTNPQGNPSASTSVGGSNGVGRYFSWDITQLIAGWDSSTLPDYGLLVRATNETTSENLFQFNSSQASTNLPYVSVKYEYGVGTSPVYTLSDFPLNDTMSGSVNVGNGNLLLCQTDLSLPGIDGSGLTVNRCLNSLTMGDILNQNAYLDSNWTMTPGPATYLDTVGASLVYHDDTGDLVPFTPDASGNYINATGFNATLTATSGSLSSCSSQAYAYQLTFDADSSTQYFNSSGLLVGKADANGNTICFFYGSGSKLSSITDTQGRTITFTYNQSTFQLASISWPGNSCPAGTCTDTYTYGGSAQNLTGVTDASGAQTTYTYNSSNQLTGIMDADGHTTTIAYTTVGGYGPDVSSITDATNKQTTFSYALSGGTFCPSPSTETDVTDPNTGVTRYCHDNGLRVSATKAPDGTTTGQTAYTTQSGGSGQCVDQNGSSADDQPCTTTDGDQNTTNYTYNPTYSQDVASVVQPSGTTSYTYDTAHNHPYLPATVKDTDGNYTAYTYDTAGNVLSQTTGLNSSLNCPTTPANTICPKTTYTYDSKGRVLTEVAPLGNVAGGNPANYTTTYAYDSAGNLLSVTDPLGHATSYTYDNSGNTLTQTDANGHVTTYTYDALNRVTSVTDARSNTTSYTYDNDGNELTETDANGHVTSYCYYPNNELEYAFSALAGSVNCSSPPTNYRTAYVYDSNGNLFTETDPDGHITTYCYYPNNELEYKFSPLAGAVNCSTPPTSNRTTYVYDGNGDETSITDANGHVTSYTYDDQGRVLTVTAPDGGVTTYTYDGNGNTLTRTDANGHTTTYCYDGTNELTSQWGPLAGTATCASPPATYKTTFRYDANGNQATTTEPNGKTITNTYDRANRLTNIGYSDTTPSVSYGYDPVGNRTSMTDGAGTVSYTYNNDNQLLSSTRGSDTFSYTYDPVGNITSRTYPGGTNTGYTYNNNNELTGATSGGATTTYGYDPAGNLTQTTLPSSNGYIETRTYDSAGRLVEVNNAKNGVVLSDYAYTLDPVGNPTKVIQTGAVSGTTTYSYDQNDRLIDVCYQASCNEGTGSNDPYTHWTYDKVGNRLTEKRPTGTTSYSYDAGDELTSAGATTYTYDANGNETAAGSRTFTYNAANQLVSTTSGGTTTTYTYDGDGNRLSTTIGGTTTNYLWDANDPIPQVALERDGSGSVLRSYIYGVSRISMTTGGSAYYYAYDGLGSVVNLTSATGAAEWTYSYEPFGAIRTLTQNDPNAPANPMQFTGELFDSASSLYNLRARQYDVTDGRFLSQDPIPAATGAGLSSLYAYTADRPTTSVDPSGEVACDGPSQQHCVTFDGKSVGRKQSKWVVVFSSAAGHKGALASVGGGNWSGKIGKIAAGLGVPPSEIKKAIHDAKRAIPGGAQGDRNPDVEVNLDNGDIRVENGSGDIEGNIYDHLPDAGTGGSSSGGSTSKAVVAGAAAGVGAGAIIWWSAKVLSPLCGPAVVFCAIVG